MSKHVALHTSTLTKTHKLLRLTDHLFSSQFAQSKDSGRSWTNAGKVTLPILHNNKQFDDKRGASNVGHPALNYCGMNQFKYF